MNTYDHYEEAKEIAALLASEGKPSEAEQILDAIRNGKSGTEIFMILRFRLAPLLDAENVSIETKKRMRVLHGKLDDALK